MATCIGLGAAALPWLWSDHEGIRTFTSVWYDGRVDQFLRSWKQIDQGMIAVSGTGNVALRFEGFSAQIPGHVQIVQEAAWRGAYAIYPRRVLVAEQGTIIGGAPDILAARFDPSVEWLQANDVRAVLHFTPVGESGFNIRPQAVPARGGR